MKESLLLRLQAELKQNFNQVRNSDIAVVPSTSFVPQGAKFPFVGIKDGPDLLHERPGATRYWQMDVHLAVIVSAKRVESVLVGDGSLLQLTNALVTMLQNNFLGDGRIERAECIKIRESRFFPAKNSIYQQQIVSFRYDLETER